MTTETDPKDSKATAAAPQAAIKPNVIILRYEQVDGYGQQAGCAWGTYLLTEKQYHEWKAYIETENKACDDEEKCCETLRCPLYATDVKWIELLRMIKTTNSREIPFVIPSNVTSIKFVLFHQYWHHTSIEDRF